MNLRLVVGLLACVVVFPLSVRAEESAKWEKTIAYSPDRKFAMRIVCDSPPADPENIDAASVEVFEIVSMPGKEVAGTLSGGGYGSFRLLWSSDSKWCAFYSMSGPRVADTSVYRLRGDKFVTLDTEELSVEVKGDVRNQYVEPVRWLKPGTLVLKQFTIFRGDAGDSTVQFTVRFDDSGKFHVISKKKSD